MHPNTAAFFRGAPCLAPHEEITPNQEPVAAPSPPRCTGKTDPSGQPQRGESLSISTYNCENVKRSEQYIRHLLDTDDIVCLQEHWLYNHEQSVLVNMASPTHSVLCKSVDDGDPISPLQRPRGMRGVAILWKNGLSHRVQKLPEGSDRICAITVSLADLTPICIVCVYMPSRGKKAWEDEFLDTLAQLTELLVKYGPTHKLILCGDWNASLLDTRGIHRDRAFAQFCRDQQLAPHPDMGTQHTYDCNGHTSQIDYILTRDPDLQVSACPVKEHHMNVSPHTPVRGKLNITCPTGTVPEQEAPASTSVPRPRWDRCSHTEYQQELALRLPALLPNSSPQTIDHQVRVLSEALTTSAIAVAPPPRKKQRPHSRQWTPELTRAVVNSKMALRNWRQAGSPLGPHTLYRARQRAKVELRSVLRSQDAKHREAYFQSILDASLSDQKTFHRLINKQRKQSTSTKTMCLRSNGQLVTDSHQVLKLWQAHYTALGIPKPDPKYDSDYLDRITADVEVIESACQHNTSAPPLVTTEDVTRALQKLNNGKAPDESGLMAEHLKVLS